MTIFHIKILCKIRILKRNRVRSTTYLSKFVGILLVHTGWDIRMRSGRGMGGRGAFSAACISYTDKDRDRGKGQGQGQRG